MSQKRLEDFASQSGSGTEDDLGSEDSYSEDEVSFPEVPLANKQGKIEIQKPKVPEKPPVIEVIKKINLPAEPQLNAQYAKSVADKVAADAVKNSKKPPVTIKDGKKAEQILKDQNDDYVIRSRLCRVMNNKKKTYGQRIDYKFRPSYDPTKLTVEQLQAENDESDIIINSQDVPTILKELIVQLSGTLETVFALAGYPMAHGFQNDMKVSLGSKVFDAELEQLSIELQDYFAMGPKSRLGWKTASILYQRISKNLQPQLPQNIPVNVQRKGQDL